MYQNVICNFWHLGTPTLSPERQSARMSKITNDTGCFIAVPICNSERQRVNLPKWLQFSKCITLSIQQMVVLQLSCFAFSLSFTVYAKQKLYVSQQEIWISPFKSLYSARCSLNMMLFIVYYVNKIDYHCVASSFSLLIKLAWNVASTLSSVCQLVGQSTWELYG